MSEDMAALTPDHSVKIGSEADAAGAGEQGRHNDVSVTITMEQPHSFTSPVEVETQPFGDSVVVESVPTHIAPELYGVVVELDGDVLAAGEYTWTDGHPPESDENTRRARFCQLVPCASCGSDLGVESVKTAVGRVCKICAYHMNNGEVPE
jgi:hypothetical protein